MATRAPAAFNASAWLFFVACFSSCHAVAQTLDLKSPPNGADTAPMAVFRWEPLLPEPANFAGYRLKFGPTAPDTSQDIFPVGCGDHQEPCQPQMALRHPCYFNNGSAEAYWTVVGVDASGSELWASSQTFSIVDCENDQRQFTTITGLVESNADQAAIIGAQVALTSTERNDEQSTSAKTETVFNGEYIVLATTVDRQDRPIGGIFTVKVSKAGFLKQEVALTAEALQPPIVILPFALALDSDGDGIANATDPDDDNDGVDDVDDAFPLDPDESVDTDGDGIGNNADADDDNDGVEDAADAFPLDPNESLDTDGDGIGNNADADDDGDGLSDESETNVHGTNPLRRDTDGDGLGDGEEVERGLNPLDAQDCPDELCPPPGGILKLIIEVLSRENDSPCREERM